MVKIHKVIGGKESCVFESFYEGGVSAGMVCQELQELKELLGLHRQGIHEMMQDDGKKKEHRIVRFLVLALDYQRLKRVLTV